MATQNIHLDISGMTCVNCSNGITKVVSKLEGLEEAKVNFSSNAGEFTYDDKKLTPDNLINKIKKLGYGVERSSAQLEKVQEDALKKLKFLFGISVILTISLFVVMFLPAYTFTSYILFSIASIVQFYPGGRFYALAYKAISHNNYDMNVLVALGTSAAYFYSTFVVFFPSYVSEDIRFVYFDGAAVIITFILFGKLLEESSKSKASSFLKLLMTLTPKNANKISEDGTITTVLATTLIEGDVIIVRQGEKLPCDGVIIDGKADINAAIITGESMPVFKSINDQVFAGTSNTNGLLKISVSKVVNESTLANIVKLINKAQGQSIPIASYANKVANVFVPVVIGLSILTFLVWYFVVGNTMSAIIAAISVLIISCPCALGLATPIGIVSAISKGAKEGILIKNPEILEIIQDIKYAVFDKTGTLTQGEISVKSLTINDKILQLVASLEVLSEHPISKAIVNYAKDKNITFTEDINNFEQLTGKGLKATIDKQDLLVGTMKLMDENNIQISQDILDDFNNVLKTGNSAIFVCVNNEIQGFIQLEDKLKKDAKQMIDDLHLKNIIPVLLTGDNYIVAQSLAKTLGITEVYADVLPEDKFNIIKDLQNNGKVMFVGDGVNDSPSLKQANIGIAMNSGSDISKEAGDIILVHNDLKSVTKSINLSIVGMKIIKQNLAFAFIYNIIGIPLAMGVFYPFLGVMLNPMFAGIAMSFSSVSVVVNSLRLKTIKI